MLLSGSLLKIKLIQLEVPYSGGFCKVLDSMYAP